MDELIKLLPKEYIEPINTRLCIDKIGEIRIINNAPVCVWYDGVYYYLCGQGITKDKTKAFTASSRAAEDVVMRACERSLYTVTDTIKRGFISVAGGIRIGVCGNGVMTNGCITAVKEFYSVNIRIPHEVKNCAASIANRAVSGGTVRNTLIVSPPGAGKTTALRDLCRLVSERGYRVLLCDEKYELAAVVGGLPSLDVGPNTDVISGIDKIKVLDMGIANMRPDVIIMDELFGNELESVRFASTCGIAVAATVHAKNIEDLKRKQDRSRADWRGLFPVCAVLSAAPRRNIELYEDAI